MFLSIHPLPPPQFVHKAIFQKASMASLTEGGKEREGRTEGEREGPIWGKGGLGRVDEIVVLFIGHFP